MFDDAVLDVLEAKVILIEDLLLRPYQVQLVCGRGGPGQFQGKFKITTQDLMIWALRGRCRRDNSRLLLADLIWQSCLCQTLTQEIRVVLFIVLAQLFLDLPELLPP